MEHRRSKSASEFVHLTQSVECEREERLSRLVEEGHLTETHCQHNCTFKPHFHPQRSTKGGGREEGDVRCEVADGYQACPPQL